MLRIEAGGSDGLSEIRLEVNDLEIDRIDPSSPLEGYGEPLAIHIMYLNTTSRILLLLETNLPRKTASLPCQALTLHLKILLIVRMKNEDLGNHAPRGEVIRKNRLVVFPVPILFHVQVSMLSFANEDNICE